MTAIWKGDLFRFGKSKLFYGIAACTCLIACSLMILTRQDIRFGISIFGNLTAFKTTDDIVRIGVQYQKGLGVLVSILLSVFIGQEYAWKTWQHKWIIGRSRANMYISKALLSSMVSIAIFLLFEGAALLCSGQILNLLTDGYVSMVICSVFVYAALGSVICMLSMLIKNNTASIIVCLGYVLFGETILSAIKNVSGLFNNIARFAEWGMQHSIYGMMIRICNPSVSIGLIFPIFLNAVIIILVSTTIGLLLFRKYEM